MTAGQIAQRFEKEGFLVLPKTSFKLVTDTHEGRELKQKLQAEAALNSSESKRIPEFWRYRPFSRVVKSYKAYRITRDYIQLNEQEALGKIKYSSKRLKGLSSADWELLWG